MSPKFYKMMLRLMGWTVDSDAPKVEKCVLLGVPHTCVADFFVSFFYYRSIGHKTHIMIKKEFFKWPIKGAMLKVGCIPVDRSNGATVVRSILTTIENYPGEFHLAIAPEGTRKAVHKWKMGYHTIAKALDCPVYLGYFDWGTKHVGVGPRVELTDDARADTDRIQKMYEEMHLVGKHPEKYCTH